MEGYVERICKGCRKILYYYTEEEAKKAETFGSHYCNSCHPDTKWQKSCTGRLAGCLAIPIALFAIGLVIQFFQHLNWFGWTVLVIIWIGAGWFYYQRVQSTKGPFIEGKVNPDPESQQKPPPPPRKHAKDSWYFLWIRIKKQLRKFLTERRR